MTKTHRLTLAAAAVILTSACGDGPTSPTALELRTATARGDARTFSEGLLPACTPERLACFTAKMELSRRVGPNVLVRGVSEDLPTPGYANRWHYVLEPSAAPLLGSMIGRDFNARVCGAAVVFNDGRGGMWMEAEGYWRLDMRPTSDDVAAQFAALAGANECRDQTFSVNLTKSGAVEILIEEPAAANVSALGHRH